MPLRPLKDTPYLNKQRAIVAPWGAGKHGKTTFGMTFPEPIHYFNWNYGLEGMIEPFKDKWIEVAGVDRPDGSIGYGLNPMSTKQDCIDMLRVFKEDYTKSLVVCNAAAGTVIIDTGTQLWDTVMTAKLEEVRRRKYSKKKEEDVDFLSFDYGEANAEMFDIFGSPLQYPMLNAVYIHSAKDEYIGKDRSGRLTMDCWKGVINTAQVICQCQKVSDQEGTRFTLRLNFCRLESSIEGLVLDEPTYEYLALAAGVTRPQG